MRNIISGVIGVLLGGAILMGFLLNGLQGAGSYFIGQIIGLIFGVLLLFGGVYYLVIGFIKRPDDDKGRRPKRR